MLNQQCRCVRVLLRLRGGCAFMWRCNVLNSFRLRTTGAYHVYCPMDSTRLNKAGTFRGQKQAYLGCGCARAALRCVARQLKQQTFADKIIITSGAPTAGDSAWGRQCGRFLSLGHSFLLLSLQVLLVVVSTFCFLSFFTFFSTNLSNHSKWIPSTRSTTWSKDN